MRYFDVDDEKDEDYFLWHTEIVKDWDSLQLRNHFFDRYKEILQTSKPIRSEKYLGFHLIYESQNGVWNKDNVLQIQEFENDLINNKDF